ncbi:MAG: Gfo/Idh/MocA family oxidoreductase [Planctomycetota bacterium]
MTTVTSQTTTSLARIGVIGCGDISRQYFDTFAKFDDVRVVAVADLNAERATSTAEKWLVPRVLSTDDLYDDPEVDIVVNLTVPRAHHEVSMRVVGAGKHVYSEKPLAESMEQGKELIEAARARGVRVGCAPDTVMGGSWQLARRFVDSGELGEIVGGLLHFQCPGHESWHPSPEFYYQRGGGPVMDLGPYFVHALVMLLGPVARVSAHGDRSFSERVITSEPKKGTRVPVEVDTHVAATLELCSGTFVTMMASFDVPASKAPDVEIYGTEATLSMHTPNDFLPKPNGTGIIEVRHKSEQDWVQHDVEGVMPAINGRGMGLVDMARSIAEQRPHRASGELALHALDVMTAVERSSIERTTIDIETTTDRPEPLDAGWC